jgi:FixJ family two-component response regulator
MQTHNSTTQHTEMVLNIVNRVKGILLSRTWLLQSLGLDFMGWTSNIHYLDMHPSKHVALIVLGC